MTLILALTGSRSTWLMADTRLSIGGRAPNDNGMKIVDVETPDGRALMGYAGLGATPQPSGTEPSDWIARVLRGRKRNMHESLEAVGAAMLARLPKLLQLFP